MAAFALDIDDYAAAWREMVACLASRDDIPLPAFIDGLYPIAQRHAAPLQSLAELAVALSGPVPELLGQLDRIAAATREAFSDPDKRRRQFSVLATTIRDDPHPRETSPLSSPPLDAEEEMLAIDNALIRFFGATAPNETEQNRLKQGLAALKISLEAATPAILTSLVSLIENLLDIRNCKGAPGAIKTQGGLENRAAQAAALLTADDVNLAFPQHKRPDEQVHPAPHWWPNWANETCVIVAGGPSARHFDATHLPDCARIVAVNNAIVLAPCADALFSSDASWWRHHGVATDFAGLRLSTDPAACDEDHRINRVYLAPERGTFPIDGRNVIGWLGNSGSHALNLVAQFGCRKIILVGFDMGVEYGVHWHPPHPKGLSNPTAQDTDLWRYVTDAAAECLEAAGVKVINTSQQSRLRRYPKMPLREALDAFREAS